MLASWKEVLPWTRKGPRAATWLERIIELFFAACAGLSIAVTAGVLSVLLFETIAFFSDVSLGEFFGDTRWAPLFHDQSFGVWPLVVGTLLTSAIAIVVALPLGLLSAIYLSEFAGPLARGVLKPMLELLAGVPTIVYGYFALIFLTPILQKFVPGLASFNALSPGIIMGVMIMPLVSSLCEDALHSVPNTLREGSLGLGASKLQTIFRVVVPSAMSGLSAAFTLAISRAIGETMIVTIAAGQQPTMTLDPRDSVETMTAFIIGISSGDVATGTTAYRTLFAVGATLFAMTFIMNFLTQRMVRKFRSRMASA